MQAMLPGIDLDEKLIKFADYRARKKGISNLTV
jgi:hypothetical protein